jgi:hypothetical protein
MHEKDSGLSFPSLIKGVGLGEGMRAYTNRQGKALPTTFFIYLYYFIFLSFFLDVQIFFFVVLGISIILLRTMLTSF